MSVGEEDGVVGGRGRDQHWCHRQPQQHGSWLLGEIRHWCRSGAVLPVLGCCDRARLWLVGGPAAAASGGAASCVISCVAACGLWRFGGREWRRSGCRAAAELGISAAVAVI